MRLSRTGEIIIICFPYGLFVNTAVTDNQLHKELVTGLLYCSEYVRTARGTVNEIMKSPIQDHLNPLASVGGC